jgi:hypothetical protein
MSGRDEFVVVGVVVGGFGVFRFFLKGVGDGKNKSHAKK